jgi:hypothetical protein
MDLEKKLAAAGMSTPSQTPATVKTPVKYTGNRRDASTAGISGTVGPTSAVETTET